MSSIQSARRTFVMSHILRMATVIVVLAFAATGAAQARGGHVARGGHFDHMGPPLGYVPQQSVTPQFNNPGPQLSVPYTGNAVDQLSPLMGAGQPDALGIK
jgi:hypothetical protein